MMRWWELFNLSFTAQKKTNKQKGILRYQLIINLCHLFKGKTCWPTIYNCVVCYYSLENSHGTRKPLWKGKSSSKPSFWSSMLIFSGAFANSTIWIPHLGHRRHGSSGIAKAGTGHQRCPPQPLGWRHVDRVEAPGCVANTISYTYLHVLSIDTYMYEVVL